MTTECTQTAKAQIAAFLPSALDTAIQSYETYYEEMRSSATDKFAEYHKNAKVALAHIELLMKLAKWAEVDVKDYQQDWRRFGSEAMMETENYHENDT